MNDAEHIDEELADDAFPTPLTARDRQVKKRSLEHPPAQEEEKHAEVEERVPGSALDGVVHLTQLRPFLALFIAYARARYSRRISPASKVDRLIQDAPVFYHCCQALDVVFLVLVCVVLIALAGANIWNLVT